MTTPLGSVLERDDPSVETGPRGRLTVDVLDVWLEAGTVLEIVVPARLACARCDGGGCDACGRSGAIRIDRGEHDRTVRVTLSESARGLRLVRPFGADAGLDQLILELRPASVPSPYCRRGARLRASAAPSFVPLLVVIAVLAAAIAAFVLRR